MRKGKLLMKKIASIFLALFFVLGLIGCNGSTSGENNSQSNTEIPPNLYGSWEEEDTSIDGYHIAYISENRIEVFLVTADTPYLYWSGSFEAPTKSGNAYVWESENDTTRTTTALFGADSETKSFSLENDKLSYDISIMGVARTVSLVRSQNDYSNISTAAGVPVETELQEVQLLDSGYSISQSNNYVYIFYAVEISNPNENYAITFPTIQIVAKSSDGKILKTENMVLFGIAAGETYKYGNSIAYEGETPATVEISVKNSENDYVIQQSSDIIYSDSLIISNISENTGSSQTTFTGEITNSSNTDLTSTAIIVIYKLGDDIIGGTTSYINDLGAGDTTAFEVTEYSGATIEYDSFEICAIPW